MVAAAGAVGDVAGGEGWVVVGVGVGKRPRGQGVCTDQKIKETGPPWLFRRPAARSWWEMRYASLWQTAHKTSRRDGIPFIRQSTWSLSSSANTDLCERERRISLSRRWGHRKEIECREALKWHRHTIGTREGCLDAL